MKSTKKRAIQFPLEKVKSKHIQLKVKTISKNILVFPPLRGAKIPAQYATVKTKKLPKILGLANVENALRFSSGKTSLSDHSGLCNEEP